MGLRRLILLTLGLNLAVFGAAARFDVIRPSPCQGSTSYLLAANSGALIRLKPQADDRLENHVIVFRRREARGWASQRLLRRFDLHLENSAVRIVNSGAFCREEG